MLSYLGELDDPSLGRGRALVRLVNGNMLAVLGIVPARGQSAARQSQENNLRPMHGYERLQAG